VHLKVFLESRISFQTVSFTDFCMASQLPLIALVGATAAGKTATSLEFAALVQEALANGMPEMERLVELAGQPIRGVEVISADSRQIYRHLSIGTAKPSTDERSVVPHHFIDVKNPDEIYSAGAFGSDAERVAMDTFARGHLPLVVGGSGLYVKALCEGLFDEEVDTSAARADLERRFATEGIAGLYKELRETDFELAERYNDLNPRRVMRALEYYHTTGRRLSEAQRLFRSIRALDTLYVGLHVAREKLYKRIDTRTAAMFGEGDDAGIVAETISVLAMGYTAEAMALNTVGYKECIAYLRGEISRPRAIELAQQSTRRYAKRQLTWFRRQADTCWIYGSPSDAAQQILTLLVEYLENKK
jgi:tRNA dimethylallyltransferase